MIKTIGIIGFGQMGKILAEIFSARFDVRIFNRNPAHLDGKTFNANISTLEETCQADLIFFCVPLQNLEDAFFNSSPFLKKDSVVIDVASVKEKSAKLMRKSLPKHVELLGTHPMFGPNSLMKLSNKNIVFCPVRINKPRLLEVRKLFEKEGFNVFTMSAIEHDKKMAKSQLFLHLVAFIAARMKIKDLSFAPLSFKLLLEAFQTAEPTKELLTVMINENRFSSHLISQFTKELLKLWSNCDKTKKRVILRYG